jgi:hypothetical protein
MQLSITIIITTNILGSCINTFLSAQFVYKDVQISSRMVARVRRLPQNVSPDFLKVNVVQKLEHESIFA